MPRKGIIITLHCSFSSSSYLYFPLGHHSTWPAGCIMEFYDFIISLFAVLMLTCVIICYVTPSLNDLFVVLCLWKFWHDWQRLGRYKVWGREMAAMLACELSPHALRWGEFSSCKPLCLCRGAGVRYEAAPRAFSDNAECHTFLHPHLSCSTDAFWDMWRVYTVNKRFAFSCQALSTYGHLVR